MKPKNKISAFGIHFLFSTIIFLLFVFFLRTFWYPDPYFTASGGWQGLKLVAFIDIVLGPVLTFIAFNAKKHISELKKDFTVIALLQLGALVFGVVTVYQQRPIAITFWENSFYTVTYKSVSQTYKNLSSFDLILNESLTYHYVPKPIVVKEIIALNDEVLKKQLPPFQLINRYESAKQFFNNIKLHSINIHEIINENKNMEKNLLKILQASNTKINENIYIPLISRYQNIILVFNPTGTILGHIKAPIKKF